MRCVSCKKTPELVYDNRNYCKSCYCKLLERRISKYLRINNLIEKDDVLYIKDPLLEHLIKTVVKGLPLKIVKKKTKNSRPVVLWTLDDEVSYFVESFFSKSFKLKTTKDIKPLRPLTDNDIALYAKFKKLKFKPNKKPHSYKYLKDLEKKYPELFFSISRSIKELEKVFR
ncbi:hypothetical protein KY337_00195 [Candidatus Woesearchaeota archaeon]|nr:hypothetical protein [Candidatus Woesearchaeota archaeon]